MVDAHWEAPQLAITFEPLREVLKIRGLNLNYLRKAKSEGGLGLSSMTTNKISHDQPVSFEVLDTLCRELRLRVEEVILYVEEPFQKANQRKRDIELTEYLDTANQKFREFLSLYVSQGSAEQAYEKFKQNTLFPTQTRWQTIGENIPSISILLSPQGGKVFLVMQSISTLFEMIPDFKESLIIWLVPSVRGGDLTIRTLRSTLSRHEEVILPKLPQRVEVIGKQQFIQNTQYKGDDSKITILVLRYNPRWQHSEDGQLVDTLDSVLIDSCLSNRNPVVIVDDIGSSQSDVFQLMLRKLNPRFVLEVSPKLRSNALFGGELSSVQTEPHELPHELPDDTMNEKNP